jgi:hypothetical protein
MNKNDFINQLTTAAGQGTLLTPKHDPNNLGTTYQDYRSVLTAELVRNLNGFIAAGSYTVTEYHNNNFPNSPYYMVIEPDPSSGFQIPASGVAAHSPNPTAPLDRLVAVSGTQQGWHLMGEDHGTIIGKEQNSELTRIGILT